MCKQRHAIVFTTRYENGQRDPGLKMVKSIAKALKFKPGEFFDNYRG